MSAAPINTTKPPPEIGPVPIPVLAALLSFMVPGLGQIVQGYLSKNFVRMSKGCLFLVCIWGMFFYGYARSQWRNVYLPHVQEVYLADDQAAGRIGKAANFMGRPMPPLLGNLWNRPQYIMQFFAGLPAWPALWNYFLPDSTLFSKIQISPGSVTEANAGSNFARRKHWEEYEAEDNRIQEEPGMGRLWDIYWIYTVLAGALNIMVIYDAYAGPVRFRRVKKHPGEGK
ncbi:MAG: hypothetical protein QM703_15345 [Gemmatales bacterium]